MSAFQTKVFSQHLIVNKNIDVQDFKIENLQDPSVDQDAVNLRSVDNVIDFAFNDVDGILTISLSSGADLSVNLDDRYTVANKIETIAGIGMTIITTFADNKNGCFIDYSLTADTNKRVGSLMCVWNADTAVFYTDYAAPEIGKVQAHFVFERFEDVIQCRVISSVPDVDVKISISTI